VKSIELHHHEVQKQKKHPKINKMKSTLIGKINRMHAYMPYITLSPTLHRIGFFLVNMVHGRHLA
jgi:hypothetical protein